MSGHADAAPRESLHGADVNADDRRAHVNAGADDHEHASGTRADGRASAQLAAT